MTVGWHADEIQPAYHRPYSHHLAGYEVDRQAEQGVVTGLQAKKCARSSCARSHPLLLYPHGLGHACRATGVYQQPWAIVIPFFSELV